MGFDLTETALKFQWSHMGLQAGGDGKSVLWDISVEAKNNEGVASIFSETEIVPASKVSGFIAYSWSNSNDIELYYRKSLLRICLFQ